jgi:hypothetical protein
MEQGTGENTCFLNTKLKEIRELAHHLKDKQLWLWTDASEGAIRGMVCQDKQKRLNSTNDLTNHNKNWKCWLSRSDVFASAKKKEGNNSTIDKE